MITFLDEPRLRGANIDVDSKEYLHTCKGLIQEKPFLRSFYEMCYQFFLEQRRSLPKANLIELGSGGGFLKEVIPELITTDVQKHDLVDKQACATNLPFEDSEIAGIFMLDVLHHIPDLNKFFEEARRTLRPGGKIIMVEPANTVWGNFIFRNFHHEPFDPTVAEWQLPEGGGPMSNANGALPWIVFRRDIELFEERFPQLNLKLYQNFSPFLYLLSGGVSKRQLLPDCCLGIVQFTELSLEPVSDFLGLFTKIVVERQD